MRVDEKIIMLHRILTYRPGCEWFCQCCMAQYKERPEQCIFCKSREFKENTLENFVNHEL